MIRLKGAVLEVIRGRGEVLVMNGFKGAVLGMIRLKGGGARDDQGQGEVLVMIRLKGAVLG